MLEGLDPSGARTSVRLESLEAADIILRIRRELAQKIKLSSLKLVEAVWSSDVSSA